MTKMLMDKERVANLVIGAQALAEDLKFSSPEEAASAAAKAAELITTYELTQADLIKAGKAKKRAYTKKLISITGATCQQQLAVALARANYCEIVFIKIARPGSNEREKWSEAIGQAENLELVYYLYHTLRREIDRLERIRRKELIAAKKLPTTANKFWNAFFIGAVDTIARRLAEQRKQDELRLDDRGDATRALVPVKDAEVKAAIEEFYPVLRNVKARAQKVNMAAYSDGMVAAHELPLSRAIKDGARVAIPAPRAEKLNRTAKARARKEVSATA